MDRFVHRENLAHYRRLLAEPDVANDQVRHVVLLQLLADEEAKNAIVGCVYRKLKPGRSDGEARRG